jgi:hypothetical protein
MLEQNDVETACQPLSQVIPPPAASYPETDTGRIQVARIDDVVAPVRRLPAVVPRAAIKPAHSEAQRRQLSLLEEFESPHNLPVIEFAKMVGKSRRWVSYEINAGNLLALNIGNRGMRVPDWHLDPARHALVQAVLKLNGGTDAWDIYHALLRSQSIFGNRPALEAIKAHDLGTVVMAVCVSLKEA